MLDVSSRCTCFGSLFVWLCLCPCRSPPCMTATRRVASKLAADKHGRPAIRDAVPTAETGAVFVRPVSSRPDFLLYVICLSLPLYLYPTIRKLDKNTTLNTKTQCRPLSPPRPYRPTTQSPPPPYPTPSPSWASRSPTRTWRTTHPC
jgi:hypothetical protein